MHSLERNSASVPSTSRALTPKVLILFSDNICCILCILSRESQLRHGLWNGRTHLMACAINENPHLRRPDQKLRLVYTRMILPLCSFSVYYCASSWNSAFSRNEKRRYFLLPHQRKKHLSIPKRRVNWHPNILRYCLHGNQSVLRKREYRGCSFVFCLCKLHNSAAHLCIYRYLLLFSKIGIICDKYSTFPLL